MSRLPTHVSRQDRSRSPASAHQRLVSLRGMTDATHSSSTPWRPSDPLRQRRGSVPGSATRHDSAATPNARSTRAVWALVTTISDADCSARVSLSCSAALRSGATPVSIASG